MYYLNTMESIIYGDICELRIFQQFQLCHISDGFFFCQIFGSKFLRLSKICFFQLCWDIDVSFVFYISSCFFILIFFTCLFLKRVYVLINSILMWKQTNTLKEKVQARKRDQINKLKYTRILSTVSIYSLLSFPVGRQHLICCICCKKSKRQYEYGHTALQTLARALSIYKGCQLTTLTILQWGKA